MNHMQIEYINRCANNKLLFLEHDNARPHTYAFTLVRIE